MKALHLSAIVGIFAVISLVSLSSLSVASAEEIKADIKTNIKQFYQNYEQQKKLTPSNELPRFVNMEDIYIGTHRPTQVPFHILAVDYQGHDIKVECDNATGHIFKVGKTRVQCMAVDSSGNELRGSFVVTVGYKVVDIPFWVKDITGYWVNDKINNDEYFQTMSYLINNDIVIIPKTNPNKAYHDNSDDIIPSWVTHTSGLYSINLTGDHEFSIAVSWLIENGFIKLTQ